MTAGIKANVDGSAAIQVGGVDAITLTSAGAASFVTSPMTIQGGSASAPSLTFSGDTNTGIFSPAADTIAFTEGGVESMRVDSAGRLLVGNTSAFYASGGRGEIDINGSSEALLGFGVGGTSRGYLYCTGTDFLAYNTVTGGSYIFGTNATERARITSGGDFLVGATDNNVGGGTTGFKIVAGASAPYCGQVIDTASLYNTYHLFNKNATHNGFRFYVKSDGGVANFSANNLNLSDERLKTDIQPAGSYLSKICAVPVKTFLYKDQSDSEPNLGVIAQDVEVVAPELVSNEGFGEIPEDGVPYKTIYQTDLQYALMKCIQELKAELDATKAEVALLKGAA